jgi:hypothetical protein
MGLLAPIRQGIAIANKIAKEAGEMRAECECANWARSIDLKYLTNHHPNCSRYNDSLIDVWKVEHPCCSTFYTDDEEVARAETQEEPRATVTKEKMHREVFENLPEFEGF